MCTPPFLWAVFIIPFGRYVPQTEDALPACHLPDRPQPTIAFSPHCFMRIVEVILAHKFTQIILEVHPDLSLHINQSL